MAFAGPYRQGEGIEVDIANSDAGDFGDAHAGGIHDFEHESVFGVVDGIEDRQDVFAVEDVGQFFIFSGMFERDGDVFAREDFFIEKFERADDLGDAGGGYMALGDDGVEVEGDVVGNEGVDGF